jgi:hypothetical protein
MMNHRESWAEERRAPTREEWQKILDGEDERPTRKRQSSTPAAETQATPQAAPAKVILRRSRSE